MLRLKILDSVSRETNRLPAARIREILNCTGEGLPVNKYGCRDLKVPSEEYVLYIFKPTDHPFGTSLNKNYFLLVKVNGPEEDILDEGECGDLLAAAEDFAQIDVWGQKLARFRFYVWLGKDLERLACPERPGPEQ